MSETGAKLIFRRTYPAAGCSLPTSVTEYPNMAI